MMSLSRLMALFFVSISLSACASKHESEFKRGCRESGADMKLCSCVYDRLEKIYGEDGLKKASRGGVNSFGMALASSAEACAIDLYED